MKRVVSFVTHKPTGKVYTIAKGLPAKILDTAAGTSGDDNDHTLLMRVLDG